jgi:hypothetical protein
MEDAMTFSQYKHLNAEHKLVPITIVDEHKPFHPVAIAYPDGTFLHVASSNVGETVVDLDTHDELVVVWDGGKKDPDGGFTKGALLDDCQLRDSLTVLKELHDTATRIFGNVAGTESRDSSEGPSHEGGEESHPEREVNTNSPED